MRFCCQSQVHIIYIFCVRCILRAVQSHMIINQKGMRIHFNEPLLVEFKTSYEILSTFPHRIVFLRMEINNVEFYTSKSFCYRRSVDLLDLLDMYLCSLILMKLQVHFISTPKEIDEEFKQSVTEELSYMHAIDCVWRSHHQQCHVKSLLRLCILCTRGSMSSLDDASFMSLPVPPYIRKLLTYRHIAEEILEEWCHSPTISS